MTITVANIRTTKDGVYIGRAMPRQRLAGSVLRNPYKIADGEDRAEVIARYEKRLLTYIQHDTPERAEIERLTELARQGDLVLLCWCKGLAGSPDIACHGDIIKVIIEQRLEAENATK